MSVSFQIDGFIRRIAPDKLEESGYSSFSLLPAHSSGLGRSHSLPGAFM